MSNPDTAQLNVEISASDATLEDTDRTMRQMPFELRELDIESAERTTVDSSETGAKGLQFALPPEELAKLIEALEKGKRKK